MNQALHDLQRDTGASFTESLPVPASFGNDAIAIAAARTGVALCDRSHWGRFAITDAHRQTFLHNQSTNAIQSLSPGQGCDTVFVTSTARTLDLATVYVAESAVRVVVSPNRRIFVRDWLDRYIFFGDKVKVEDITDQTAMFSLIGPASADLLKAWETPLALDAAYASHALMAIAGCPVQVAVGEGLAIAGYTLIMAAEHAGTVWQALTGAGAVPLGDRAWEHLRIEQGRPVPDQELTEEFNAVEACLWHAISINKGCYIGQETIARLDTYKGVKQQLWGIRFTSDCPADLTVPTPITLEQDKVGVLTSLTTTAAGTFGLGYVRTKVAQAGMTVQIGAAIGELVEVPFGQRDRC